MEQLSLGEMQRLFDLPSANMLPGKVIALEESLRAHVRPGMTLHFGYSEGRPMAISNALVRCFHGTAPGFTVVGSGLVSNQAALVSEGIVKRLEVSFVGENYPTPAPNRILQAAINRGDVEIENQSLLAIYHRLAAGALGVPFYPTRSWAGTSLEKNSSYAKVTDPFGGTECGVLRALVPDISFVHGLAADPQGNILLSPPFGEAEVAAFASRLGVIATVEKIVTHNEIVRNPTLMKIPAHRVLSVSLAPLGCHPYGIYSPEGLAVSDYVDDYDFFIDLRAATRDEKSFRKWTEKWILETKDHDEYVALLGAERVRKLYLGAEKDAWKRQVVSMQGSAEAGVRTLDPAEVMVSAAAALLIEKVLDKKYGIIEAGVGYANLAAWLAASSLQIDHGTCVELVAEIGMYGFSPRPGEPFIFSHRNLPTSKGFTTVEALLGYYVAGAHNKCIAIIGAGQINQSGDINSTYAADGRFLVGSGGANDITSGAAEVIAVTKQTRERLVDGLPYVTSAGRKVTTLVTDLGVFEKRDGRFVLTRYFGEEDEARSITRIRENCGWPLIVDDAPIRIRKPDDEHLKRLALFDPRNDFFTAQENRGLIK